MRALVIIGVILTKAAIAQDSLVSYQHLSFDSNIEKKAFEHYVKNSAGVKELFALFFNIDQSLKDNKIRNAYTLFNELLSDLSTQKMMRKNPEKKVELIYEKVHERFLEQYVERNLFPELFESGKYNCVSATALYGMYFDTLSIPYSIKEKPTHVYMVAYPNKEQILVEPTDPQKGYVRFSPNNKQTLVDRLVSAKMISTHDKNSMSTDDLFAKYYLADETISLKELVGIQYLNDAIYRSSEEDKIGAVAQAQKAWFFYPSEKTKNLLMATTLEYLEAQDYSSDLSIHYLAQLMRFDKLDLNFVLNEFNRMISILLIDGNNSNKLEAHYHQLLSELHNEMLEHELVYLYNYELGRINFNQGKSVSALSYFKQAYLQKPTNLNITGLLLSTLSKILTTVSNLETIEILEAYKNELPRIKENDLFKSMLVNSYLIQFGHSFDLSKGQEGEYFKSLFEKNYSPELSLDQDNLGRAYSLAAVYYFRKGNTKKAKSIINQGLNKAPHNYELLARKRMIN